jgi:3-phosphoshikimate 1-carboxyvinyltransferase
VTGALHIPPGSADGRIVAPASKSDAQRALAAASLARGRSVVSGCTPCADTDAARGAIVALGSRVEVDGDTVVVHGWDHEPQPCVDCGESGLSLRMFTPIAALHSREITLDGRGTLRSRPIGMLEDALRSCGASCRSEQGRLPLVVRGPLGGGSVTVDGSVTSQHITGLLFALPLVGEDSRLVVDHPTSRPYLSMTLRTLAAWGVAVDASPDLSVFSVPCGQHYRPTTYEVEGDWSGASCLLVAGAIAGRVAIGNLDNESPQADRAIVDALRRAGARVQIDGRTVTVEHGALSAFECDAAEAPDLVPALVTLACYCEGTSRIAGIARLRHKESDRISALHQLFEGLGGRIATDGDAFIVTGGPLRGGVARTHHDHRMAMAASVAALRSNAGVTLDDSACVSKSYPRFYEDLNTIGVRR